MTWEYRAIHDRGGDAELRRHLNDQLRLAARALATMATGVDAASGARSVSAASRSAPDGDKGDIIVTGVGSQFMLSASAILAINSFGR